jgi:class 3 adenylate cyclase/tetratricopeptide (TPR) repeat protein
MGNTCIRCQFDNRQDAKFCIKCGAEIGVACSRCGKKLPSSANFCDECGHRVKSASPPTFLGGERKYVTVLFTDISGYTAISEKLDPEELKEFTSLVFSRITTVIRKYDGFIEKYVGDAIVAFFGAHKAHEDDPVRAIRAAREIHDLVTEMSPHFEGKIGQPLSMHTGINTGIAVTGQIHHEKGTHGVVGDTVNLASRLSDLGKENEILIGPDTYDQSEGYFLFEERKPAKFAGKSKLIPVYRVLAPLDRPRKIHRVHGLRARFIGRTNELGQLKKAVDLLRGRKGSIFSICGPPGTGKSRLIEEFRATLDLNEIQWSEGHAYPYAQNIPYFPVINLISRAFRIGESDTPDRIKEKIERGVKSMVGPNGDEIPLLGSLYNLEYPELENMNPEFWKDQLQKAIQSILMAMAAAQPTVLCLEDLHWADPSSLELLRRLILEAKFPILFLFVFRPTISLFSLPQKERIRRYYREIQLQDLTSQEAQNMLESLLSTEDLPVELRDFIEKKMEGNPFYLEEAINSLIESDILVKEDGRWSLSRPITDADISRSIQGVISARLDRLGENSKRVLQEAAVIGRTFFYEVLNRITTHKKALQNCLDELVSLDLLRVELLIKGREYSFKHAIIQEVVYNGLLRRDCQEIHERIGGVIEEMFKERLAEFFETLAFHFQKGKTLEKAVHYLIQSGKKSMKRYSVEESHQYYREAYNLINQEISRIQNGGESLINLLNTWAPVFYFRGSFKELETLFKSHLELADSLEDRDEQGMFYVWYGMSLWGRARFKDAYRYLHTALKIGEEIDSKRIMGYVGAWLPWPCVELGLFEEAFIHAERARVMSDYFEADDYPYYQSLDSTAFVHFAAGEPTKIRELGEALLEYGREKSMIRAITWGYYVTGWSYMAAGDFTSSIQCNQKAIQSSPDPFYTQFPKLSLGMSYVSNEEYANAKEFLQELLDHSQNYGSEILGTAAQVFLGVVFISEGRFSEGMQMVKDAKAQMLENHAQWRSAIVELILGEINLNIALRKKIPISVSMLMRECFFLLKNIPLAGRKAEDHFLRAINYAQEIGAKSVRGQAYFGLGRLYAAKKRKYQAKDCLTVAHDTFEECKADTYLEEVKEVLLTLRDE